MRMFIAFSLSFVSSLLRMRKYYSCKIRSHLCMRSSLRDVDGGGDGRKARKEFHTNSKRRRTFKNLFFIKPKRINLFHSVSSSILPPSVLLHGRLLQRQRLRCSVLNISFIISPREPTGAWRKVQGSNASAEQKIYNSNSRYSRNKKFTFIMQIDIKCCAVERNPLSYIFFTQIVLGSVPRRFEGNLFAIEESCGGN